MNRDLTTASSGQAYGAPVYRRQTIALYGLLDQLRKAYPDVEIESCASGAARADYGILAYTHQIWASDNNDALDRQAIQRGFSRFFPPELMGAHIGPAPAHISYRRHTLGFRAATALFGHLGLELDVRSLSDSERAELKNWAELYKQFRTFLHGECYLCPGNTRAGGFQNPAFKETYAFDNDFSALLPDIPQGEIKAGGLLMARAERGICRVICFSPRHDLKRYRERRGSTLLGDYQEIYCGRRNAGQSPTGHNP